MIMHTYVMSIGGKRFSFYMWIKSLSHFSFGPLQFWFVRMPSTLDTFIFKFFFSNTNNNAYICDVHKWKTFLVLYVN